MNRCDTMPVDTARMRLAAMSLQNALDDLEGGDLEAAKEAITDARNDLAEEFDV